MAGPYYVDVTTGDDGDTGLTEALAFQTLSHLADTIAAGEIAYVKASASYTVQDGANDAIMQLTTAGSAGSPIVIIGYTTTITDGGVVTIDATSTLANAVNSSLSALYYIFKNFRFTNATGTGFSANSVTGDYTKFENCQFDNNADWGFQGDNAHIFHRCTINNNNTDAGEGGGIDADFWNVITCSKIHTNAGYGVSSDNGDWIGYGNVLYGNGGNSNLRSLSGSEPVVWINNTIDGDDSASSVGINQDSSVLWVFIALNNIIMDCATGLKSDVNAGTSQPGIDNNMLVSCATDYTGVVAGDNDIDTNTDPFTASATRDYTLADASAAIDAGTDSGDV
jgi:hypothetical protein